MSNVSFKRGLSTGLSNLGIVDGQLIICTDTKELYTDVGSSRLKISDVQVVANMQALPAVASAIKGKFYYAEAENVFCFPHNGEWKQVNPDTGATSIEFVGSGNAVTAASYDPLTRKITLTKGETFATKTDVDTIQAAVDNTVEAATAELNYIAEGMGAGKTIASLTQVDGQIAATFQDISITKSQISDFAHNHDDRYYTEEEINAKVATLEEADAALSNKIGTIDEGKTVAGLITEAKADAKAAKDAADAAQTDIDTLEGKIGTITEGKTIAEMIADAQKAAEGAAYDDAEVRGLIQGNAAAIQAHKDAIDAKVTTLVGADADKSVRTIANEELAKQLIPEGAKESLDTLTEIATWIQNHPDDASAMNTAIAKLQDIVDGIGGDGEKATVVAYVTDAIAALNLATYAKQADLDTHTGDTDIHITVAERTKWDAAEGKAHEHANKALLDTYTQTEVDLAEAVAKKHDHANAAELAKIADGDVAKWNAAQANAEATAAGALADAVSDLEGKISAAQSAAEGKVTELANGAVKTNADAIAVLQSGKADKATTLAGYGITNAYTKTEVDSLVNNTLVWGEF